MKALLRYWAVGVSVGLLSIPTLFVAPRAQAQTPVVSPSEWVATSCTIAQWRGARILDSYDINEEGFSAVLAEARGFSFPVALSFPDVPAFRARISSVVDRVCAAPDPAAAKSALDELKAADEDIRRQFGSWKGISGALKGAQEMAKERIGRQLKAYSDQRQQENKALVAAEAQRLWGLGLTKEQIEPQLQAFGEQLRAETRRAMEARAEELRRADPDSQRLGAIGTILKGMKANLEASAAAGKADWPQLWSQVVQTRKALHLRNVDDRIAKITGRIEERATGLTIEQRDAQGITALLAAVRRARQDLEPALETALAARDEGAVRAAIGDLFRRVSEASVRQICTSAVPKLQAPRQWATETLENLRARPSITPQVQAAIEAIEGWVENMGEVEGLCGSTSSTPSVREMQETLNAVAQGNSEVRDKMQALESEANP